MAHYDIFREELAQKFYAYGHALWEPDPELYGPVAIGDVGYIWRGKFHRIFNALLPKDDPTHTNFGTPESYEPLQLDMEQHIDTGTLSPNDFCSAEVKAVSGGLNIFSLRPEGSAEASFECSKRRGASLSIPVPARREDTVAQRRFGAWIIKHIDSWFSFAQSRGLEVENMEDIVLVTGCHRTRSYTNILFSESRDGTRVSFGVRVGSSGADIAWEVSREQIREVQIQRGPSGNNLSEDQCIFVRGFRATRFLGIFPARLRGAAGSATLAGSDSHNPPSDKQLISTSIPESNTDPLSVLLRYIAEKEPDSDMFLVHDDDLGCIGGAVLGSLQPDILMDYLRNSQLNTQAYDCGYMAGPSQVPVKVGMLSKRALDVFSPIPAMHSPRSEPSDTTLLESAHVPSNFIESRGSTSGQQSYTGLTPFPFARSEGFLTKMFGQRDAAFFIESLLKVDSREVYLFRGITGLPNALMSQTPSAHDTHYDAVDGFNRPLWLLDIVAPPMYHVVPQKIWTPPNQSDWRRYVEQASLRMPVFFIRNDGEVGLPLARALAGDTASLRSSDMPAPLGGGHSTQIRIAWPGYESWERQIQIRDQTRRRNEITLERFAKLVAGVVDRFLTVASSIVVPDSPWRVGLGGIDRNNVVIVGAVQVSPGGWMPILQFYNPISTPTTTKYYPAGPAPRA